MLDYTEGEPLGDYECVINLYDLNDNLIYSHYFEKDELFKKIPYFEKGVNFEEKETCRFDYQLDDKGDLDTFHLLFDYFDYKQGEVIYTFDDPFYDESNIDKISELIKLADYFNYDELIDDVSYKTIMYNIDNISHNLSNKLSKLLVEKRTTYLTSTSLSDLLF